MHIIPSSLTERDTLDSTIHALKESLRKAIRQTPQNVTK